MKKIIRTMIFGFLALAAPAFASVQFPSIDVLNVNKRLTILQSNVTQAIEAENSPVKACFRLGQASTERQNLIESACRISDLAAGVLVSGNPLPDWLSNLMTTLNAVLIVSTQLTDILQPCVADLDPGKAPLMLNSAELNVLKDKLQALSAGLSPFAQQAIAELTK